MKSTDIETGRPLPPYTVKYTENKLTDEEVWLRVYCAAMSCPIAEISPLDCADTALDSFHGRFKTGRIK